MSEVIIASYISPDSEQRLLIVLRADGLFSYRRQWSTQTPSGPEWGVSGPYSGLYDFAEMAEAEARARVDWMRNL